MATHCSHVLALKSIQISIYVDRICSSYLKEEHRNFLDYSKELAAQRGCGCPIPRSVQGQTGWGFERPGLVADVLAYSRGVGTR